MSKIALQDSYSKAREQLRQDLGYNSIMAVPRIRKIVVSSGVGKANVDKRYLQDVESIIAIITAQKPVVTIAKKSISNFKLRKGMKVGSKVTLRGDKMFWFLERLIDIVFPRIRDFHGLNYKSFDAQGNYNLGFREHTIFPEIDIDKYTQQYGLQVTIVFDSINSPDSEALLRGIGMPLRKRGKNG